MESRQNRKLLRSPECRLKRFGLRQSLKYAHEQRPGVHNYTSTQWLTALPQAHHNGAASLLTGLIYKSTPFFCCNTVVLR